MTNEHIAEELEKELWAKAGEGYPSGKTISAIPVSHAVDIFKKYLQAAERRGIKRAERVVNALKNRTYGGNATDGIEDCSAAITNLIKPKE